MSEKNKKFKYTNCMLHGALKKNGYLQMRYVFSGINRTTGEEKQFFIEMYMLNPAISPLEAVLAQKCRPKMSADDIQYALAGTQSAQKLGQEESVRPSYVLIKAGAFGARGKIFNKFIPAAQLIWDKQQDSFRTDDCLFTRDTLTGQISVAEYELREKPELLCDSGQMVWELHYEQTFTSDPLVARKSFTWTPTGIKTLFSGTVTFDGVEYSIIPRRSFGYIDKTMGPSLNNPLFHISSSNLTSMITGQVLSRSFFAIKGEYDGKLNMAIQVENEKVEIKKSGFFERAIERHECTEAPAENGGTKLHWSVSIRKKHIVIDIDVFCNPADLCVREYEIPAGGKTVMKVLGGASGYGELRIYKRVRKDLELLEHARVASALCDLGNLDNQQD